MKIRFSVSLLALILFLPLGAALPHGGGLDGYGCHHNRKLGGYHCHRGRFAGQHFSSKAEMLQERGIQGRKKTESRKKQPERVCVREEGTDRIVCGVLVEELPSDLPRKLSEKATRVPTPYDRSLYGGWIDEDGDCQNTRAEVLIRDDDDGNVQFKTARECRVVGGTWYDPYTGQTFGDPSKLDVDHVVPLKNAHQSGAWAWTPEKKREFANYLEDDTHLLAVSASENRRKGAKGPDGYLPPTKSFHCEYVRKWVSIKTDWKLAMSASEKEAVERVMEDCSP